jgi:hypothetical protein
MMDNITVFKLKDVFIIKKKDPSNFFTTTADSIIINHFSLYALLKFMLFRELISPKTLEGILGEYYDSRDS